MRRYSSLAFLLTLALLAADTPKPAPKADDYDLQDAD
jgi:hypothetical protein